MLGKKMRRIDKIILKPAECAVDLSDGSERGLYVDQDYILQKLGRPHRAVNIMYCYYPHEKTWPVRASEAYKNLDVSFAWGYPYDDYFTYKGGIGGTTDDEPFTCMRDIRRHGQDVILTLTCDPKLEDEYIVQIARELKPFGRMMLRLNHECTGNWFSFTKRASYREIADFFVRFHRIIKEYAPNVSMILCAGAADVSGSEKVEMEDEFLEAVRETEIWSIDKYIALNWGWPYEVAEKNNRQHKGGKAKDTFDCAKKTYKRYAELTGMTKPIVLSEINADGDVTGPYEQCRIMQDLYDRIRKNRNFRLSASCFYQFRDDGRLGLEKTSPNNPNVGIEQPILKTYREIIHNPFFEPKIADGGKTELPVRLRWGSSEDAEGIAMKLHFKGEPVFAEANFEGELEAANLILELNDMWFYKAPGVKFVDFMPAFYNSPLNGKKNLTLKIFAPPAGGENDISSEDLLYNFYYELKDLPKIRLRFEPICV